MMNNSTTWIKNRKGINVCVELGVALYLLGSIPLIPLVTAIGGSLPLSIIGSCFILTFVLLVFIRIVPFHVGFKNSTILFKGPFGGSGKQVQIPDVVQVRYIISQGGLQKTLRKRLYVVNLDFPYGATTRKICDGIITEKLIAVLPKDRSKLVVTTFGGVTIEERAPTV